MIWYLANDWSEVVFVAEEKEFFFYSSGTWLGFHNKNKQINKNRLTRKRQKTNGSLLKYVYMSTSARRVT